MKKITLLTILNLLVFTLFGQMFMEGLPHPFELDEVQYTPNPITQLQSKQGGKQILDSTTYQSYASMEWVNSLQDQYTYNSNERTALSLRPQWNENTQQWEDDIKTEYTYDNDNNLILSFNEKWDSDTQEWLKESKYEHSYNDIGNLTSSLSSVWQDGAWVANIEDQYTYNNDGNLALILKRRWYESIQQWINYLKYENTHNDEGQLTFRLRSVWDNNNTWFPATRYDYTYHNGDLITYLITNFSTITQQWIPSYELEYGYDTSYTYDELITPFSGQYHQHKRISGISKSWDENAQEWINNLQRIYYYSEQTVGITPATEAGIEIFPNPANDFITFNLENTKPATVQLYDAQGKHIRTQALAQNNQLSVHHLDSGTYFYQLLQNGEMYSGKFIVK